MKIHRYLGSRTFSSLCFAGALLMSGAAVMSYTSCTTTTSQQVTTYQTLKTVGMAADSAMTIAAGLYHNGQVTSEQWQQIADLHDNKFIPAYKLAIQASQSDLSSLASPDLLALSTQLAALVASFQTK